MILPNIGISEKNLAQMTQQLNALLADEFILYIKTLKYHWNIVGKHFGPLHKLFDDQYNELLDHVDRIAERVVALGGQAIGTGEEFLKHSSLTEEPNVYPDEKTMINNLLNNYETIIQSLRKLIAFAADIKDEGSVNFLGELIEKQEKQAWILRAHLQ